MNANRLLRTKQINGRINNYPLEAIYPHDAWAMVRYLVGERSSEPTWSHIPIERRVMLMRRVMYLLHGYAGKHHEKIGSRLFRQTLKEDVGEERWAELKKKHPATFSDE